MHAKHLSHVKHLSVPALTLELYFYFLALHVFCRGYHDSFRCLSANIGRANRVLDLLFTLDYLKNLKSSWNNDFAAYKRAKSNLKQVDPTEAVENQELYMFLANQNTITVTLRTQLATVDSFQDIFIFLVSLPDLHFACFPVAAKLCDEQNVGRVSRHTADPPSHLSSLCECACLFPLIS